MFGKKFVIWTLLAAVLFGAALEFTYLKVLPYAVSNPKVISYVEYLVQKYADIKLDIKNPVLKTEFSPKISFKVDELSVLKNNSQIIAVNNFNTEISLKEIFSKNILINTLGADYIFADINKLSSLSQPQKKEQVQKNDWNFDFFDSVLYVKKSLFLYKIEPSTYFSLNADDLKIDNTQKNIRFVHFNITTDIKKDGNNLHFNIEDKNTVFIKNKAIFAKKLFLTMNNSKIFFDGQADKKNNFDFKIYSDKINVSDVLALINSNIIENNLSEPLAFFKDLDGNFNFDIKMSNNSMDGIVGLNGITCKVVPINNIPINLQQGKIILTKDVIKLVDFKGFYNNRRENELTMEGSVKDYLKSIDTNIVARANVTNDFMKNYLSEMVNIPIGLIGGNTRTKLELKAINNKIDIIWLFGLKKGQDLLVDGASLTPADYLRGVKADMHFEDNLLDIKSIDYYIMTEDAVKAHEKIQPVLKLAGLIDCANSNYKTFGFEMPKELPSEFLNIFVGEKFFKRGKIAGHMQIDNTGKYPVLDGKLTMDGVAIPSQRIFLKHGEMNTENGLLNLKASGKYRRSAYDFSGNLVNELKFPLVAKNVDLIIDDIDVEKFVASANNQNSQSITSEKFDLKPSGEAKNDDDDTPTFDIGNFVVENCNLNILKGKYKDIEFKNVQAGLTLDKNSILNMSTNLFEIADGYTNAKVNCDLKEHLYKIRLGIKEVNSDLLATNILSLKKEITGKASGLIELNTDETLKLNGSIKFLVENGTIQKVGLIEYVLKFAALFRNPLTMISPTTFSDLVNIPDGNFDKINGDLQIKNNIIERMMIKSTAPQLSSFIVGRYNLENGDAALRIYTKFSNRRKGLYGALRNISLNSLANRIPLSSRSDSNYYAAELSQLPPIDADEKDCQVFLTKVDGDVEHNNFISSLKKIK